MNFYRVACFVFLALAGIGFASESIAASYYGHHHHRHHYSHHRYNR